MELIYENSYGASYKIENAPNPTCKLQMVIDTIGIFMSETDLAHLLEIVRDSGKPCFCEECKGQKCSKIWCNGPFHDMCLKMDESNQAQLEDLILGTQFILNMDQTLEKYSIN
ncbi:hypothetical protein [Allomuricauda sp. SCSIO 65647]|uniref:hypothetical protein n=1 Tax=Allomuricauda sp. SCSIO 65647 TaxID=2908843 RepID=UPI001F47C1FE|nr:hypothetical protein [Muricauda sp. SCSIO 65647]UJH66453.1 hypothetical protein L0P89_10785 [Muricauda sp. SCSIO 65647]